MSSTRALFIGSPFSGINGLPDPQGFANMAISYADVFWQMPVMNPVGGISLSPTPNDALSMLGDFLIRCTNPVWIWISLSPNQQITVPLDYTPLSGPPSDGDIQLSDTMIADITTIMNWMLNIQTMTGYQIMTKVKGICMPFDTSIPYGDNLTQAQKVFLSRNTMNAVISYVRTTYSKPTAVDAPYPEDALTLTAPPSWRSNNPGGTQTPSLLGNDMALLDCLIMRNPINQFVYNSNTGTYVTVFLPSRMQQFLSIQNAYAPTYRNLNIIVRQDFDYVNYLPNDGNGGINPGPSTSVAMILDRAGFGEIGLFIVGQTPTAYFAYDDLFDDNSTYVEPYAASNIADFSSLNGICELTWLVNNPENYTLTFSSTFFDFDASFLPLTTVQQFTGQY